jgi:hypothetical protein
VKSESLRADNIPGQYWNTPDLKESFILKYGLGIHMKNNNAERPSHWKYKIAAVILTPLFIAVFLSIVSLRAEIFSRSKNFKFQHILNKIVKIFERDHISVPYNSARAKIAPIETAIDAYLLNTREYPATLNDLVNDPGLMGWSGPYLYPNQLNDTWGRPYIYIPNGKSIYTLISYGADGKPGGEGYNEDINNK